jgi:hypothetical protein
MASSGRVESQRLTSGFVPYTHDRTVGHPRSETAVFGIDESDAWVLSEGRRQLYHPPSDEPLGYIEITVSIDCEAMRAIEVAVPKVSRSHRVL